MDDPRIVNVGILLEDNDTKIKNEIVEVKDESVYFIKSASKNQKTYKKGDLVILDVDTVVYEEDFSLESYVDIDITSYLEMEHRYQIEKIKSNKKK